MDALKLAIEDARDRYAALNPLSNAAEKKALKYLPGGNTRSVLHFEPFPLTMVSGEGAELTDLDGHRYVDFVGEYSAGLFGHSDPRIKAAINEALDAGIAMGAPMKYERTLAALLCERYPALEQVRFCNSGTEANLMALTTACAVTGRDKILAFRDAYHGGVIKFPGGRCELNVPYDFVLVGYNDIEGAAAIIRGLDDELAAVIVEPILGAGGNIPGNREFLNMLRRCTEEVGALLIFDEIKTARLGAAGVHGMLDFKPDLVTVGKFIAGGLPTGAFGGRADLMARYDPRHGRGWNHAGTFNNNACSMAAGCVAMKEVFPAKRGAEFLEWSEAFRLSLNEMFAARDVPMYANGMGSIIAIHFSKVPTKKPSDITAGCQSLRPLLHMEMLLEGVLICKRGDFFLSLPMDETHLAKARRALDKFIDKHQPLIEDVLKA
ncbi:MAG: aminotransferase class III-fold pyridoxal phosphate-dependent enzyme [Gammaproteobacteria bacterium]|jgi:glutamate-1-semialdehyde 2,1-aminomutase|nr:aminotransferase class III-fold pyridoxal phosphate-dependent enzyme [Gammaproteobacteria bacterium]MDH3820756.1 aminotransferase class III-fold pyridoxal phosphate-dependent enzyme [Gammaproteobacteria bacterium]